LEQSTTHEPERLVRGLGQPDDAVVYRLEGGLHLLLTADFFGPVVDDAYTYGAIAAANSISDIYAMGGKPFLALNLASIPADMPPEIATAIFQGGADKAREAGVIIAGGHTMDDKEPKYGLVVLGTYAQEEILTKDAARPGDRLVYTKPLGMGIITTCIKKELVTPRETAEVTRWMLRLNRDAVAGVRAAGARAATDVTGFGLLGHALEMSQESGVGLRLQYDQLQIPETALRFAREWHFPGGALANSKYYDPLVTWTRDLPPEERMLLHDPQTNGGILAAIPAHGMSAFVRRCSELEQPCGKSAKCWRENRVSRWSEITSGLVSRRWSLSVP